MEHEVPPPSWMIIGLVVGVASLLSVIVALVLVSQRRNDIEEDIWGEE
jgi:hypothetical protein